MPSLKQEAVSPLKSCNYIHGPPGTVREENSWMKTQDKIDNQECNQDVWGVYDCSAYLSESIKSNNNKKEVLKQK